MITQPGQEITWGELQVGSRSAFAAAGFHEVSRPTKRRVLMRIDLTVDAEDDWHSVYVDGRPRLGIQLAPGHVPPQWPDGMPQRIHRPC
jgi:hypothetical protein